MGWEASRSCSEDRVAKSAANSRQRSRSCFCSTVISKCTLGLSRLESGEFSHGLKLLGITRNRIEQQMIGTGRDQFLEAFGHMFRGAVDAGCIGSGGIVVDLGEPAIEFGARHGGPLIDRHEHSFRDRKSSRIAA